MPNPAIQPLGKQHLEEAMALVWSVFLEFEAPDYSQAGIDEFKRYIAPDSISDMMANGALLLWGCMVDNTLVGVAALRPPGHVSLLFVDPAHHHKGYARAMMDLMEQYVRQSTGCRELTVHASPYALEVYRRMGFVATSEEQTENGLRFTPMTKSI